MIFFLALAVITVLCVVILLLIIDINHKRRSLTILHQSENRLRAILDNVPDPAWLKDKDGRFLAVNEAWCGFFNRQAREIIGETISLVLPEDQAEQIAEEDRSIIKTGEVLHCERIFKRSSGQVLWFDTVKAPLRDDQGVVVGTVGLARDVTDRKLAQEEHVRLVAAIEHAADAIIITDRKGNIEYVNPAFELISGFDRGKVIGLNFGIFRSDKHPAAFYKAMWVTIKQGQVWTGRTVNRMKDGRLCEFETQISPIRSSSGEVVSFVSVNRDITREVRMEGQLRQAQKMQSIGTLAGGIAHDFNNILSAIIGYTELSTYKLAKSDPVREYLEQVLKAGHRAKDLVKQILAFSRQNEQEKSYIQLGPIIKEALKLLRASLPSTIAIHQNIPFETGVVMADPTQIHQVLMNLCTNAAHAMREKGGVLDVSLAVVKLDEENVLGTLDLKPGSYVRLTVRDTGHGMSRDVFERIFEPYFTTKGLGEGTGMGLAVVYGIVRSHNGAITASSEPGLGSTFHIHLPLVPSDVVQEEEERKTLPLGTERILFVDDEEALADLGRRMLEHLGYEVVVRTSSVEALETFRKASGKAGFDLVMTDQTMPDMTGLELIRELRSIRPDIPVILCTGFSESISPESAEAMGIGAFLMKPLVLLDLAVTIRTALKGSAKGPGGMTKG